MNILKFDFYGRSTIPYGALRALRTVPDNDMQSRTAPSFLQIVNSFTDCTNCTDRNNNQPLSNFTSKAGKYSKYR